MTPFALSVLRTPVKVGIRCCLSCLASFRHTCLGRWTAVGVEVERPQRSEDERPRGRRGSAANLAGRGRGKDVAVQVICCLLGEKNVLRETTSHVPAPSLTRKSDGEWAAEGTRRSRVMWYCCGFGIMRRHR